jgi:hypothetical protein
MKKVNILAIRIDGGTQSRDQLNEDVVKDYADCMKDGAVFPPITVFFDGSDYWLADGFHRYFANKTLGNVALDCDVKEGTCRDAVLYSFGANGKNGLPPTAKEKRNIVIKMLRDEEWGKWSNKHIATIVHVSSMTVGRIKKELEEEPKEKVTYLRQGVEVEAKKPKKAQKKKEEPVAEPVVVDPAPVNSLNPLEIKIDELSRDIIDYIEEITKLKDVIATKRYDATEFEQEDALMTIQELREEIKLKDREIKSLRDSRDMYQERNAELIKQLKAYQKKK